MLQQATLFVPVKSVSLNVANNKCVDVNDICGELPAGDKYDLSFVRWGEANAKFLPKNIGIEFANKVLITDENGYIRTAEASYIIEEQVLSNYLTKEEAQATYGTLADIENLQSQITTNTNDILLKQNITDNTLTTTDKTIVGAINEIKESVITADIITVDITPRTLIDTTLPSGLTSFNVMVVLPVDYNFEILGVVSAKAKFEGSTTTLPLLVSLVNKINYQGYNIDATLLCFNTTSQSTGDLTINIKLLIRKV